MRNLLSLVSSAVLVVSLLAAPGLVSAQSAQGDIAALVRQVIDARNRHDLATALALLTDDYVQEGGACTELPGGRCVGKTAYAEQAAHDEGHMTSTLSVLDTQISGNVVTLQAEIRFSPNLPPLQAAGIDRLVEIGRAEMRDGKIASERIVLDVRDAATARVAASGAPGVPHAQDGQTLASQSLATRAAFVSVYGVDSLVRWAQEHNAALTRAGV